jgi:predicted enzyme related to lactoylglutathione lyase
MNPNLTLTQFKHPEMILNILNTSQFGHNMRRFNSFYQAVVWWAFSKILGQKGVQTLEFEQQRFQCCKFYRFHSKT